MYTYIGVGSPTASGKPTANYRVTLRLFRDCASSGPQLEAEQVTVGIYANNVIVKSLPLNLQGAVERISLNTGNFPCLSGQVSVCYEVALYTADVNLEVNAEGYFLARFGCCRVDRISNLAAATNVGSNYVTRIPGTNAYHCGLMVKYWNESGPVTKHLHAWGISPRQGETGGCKIDSVSPSRVGGFTINSPVLVPQSACECIVNNIEAYHNFMDRHDKYRAVPSNSCDGAPSCNSNFASACQLSKCNISHRPSVWAPGFDHRMKSCKKRKKVKSCVGWRSDTKTDEYRCECDEWEPVDSDVCGSN